MNEIQAKQRKRNRLEAYDYSTPNWYFVTLCEANKRNYFGTVKSGKVVLGCCGEIVRQQWRWLADHFSYVRLEQFVIMPNHFHGILIIDPLRGRINDGAVGTSRDLSFQKTGDLHDGTTNEIDSGRSRPAPTAGLGFGGLHDGTTNGIGAGRSRPAPTVGGQLLGERKIKSLSEIIGAFKTTSSRRIHQAGFSYFQWQRSYYDHIIRHEKSLYEIQKYIQNNPLQWEVDRYYERREEGK